jgi:thiol-disulfide isomerase/thioredoxin
MSRRSATLMFLVVALGLVAIVVAGCGSSGVASAGVTLKGTTLSGAPFDLTTYRGKPTVINVFASWCPPCNDEAPELVAVAKANPGVGFVGIDTGDEKANGQGFVDQYGVPYPVVFDSDGAIAKQLGAKYLPTTIFLDANGVEKDRIVGSADRATFEEKLKSIQ